MRRPRSRSSVQSASSDAPPATRMSAPAPLVSVLDRWGGWLLAVATLAVYSATLGAGFLSYDDPWLVETNPLLDLDFARFVVAIFSDFQRATRLALGAEFLPLRDLLLWCEVRAFGRTPEAMHLVSVVLFVLACVALRDALRATFTSRRTAEFTAWAFAMSPVHVESVAWIANQKDVLALLFSALALRSATRADSPKTLVTATLFACAVLAKAMAIAALPLVVAFAWAKGRPLNRRTFAALGLVAISLAAVHVHAGGIVRMTTTMLGGSRLAALSTMGPVFVRYLRASLDPSVLSIAYDVNVRSAGDVAGLGSWSVFAIWLAAGWKLRSRRPAILVGAIVFLTALAPVSHVVVSLANLMADRYLCLAVLGPLLVVGEAATLLGSRVFANGAVAVATIALGAATASRTLLFADETLLWTQAVSRTQRSTLAPFALGVALEKAGRDEPAIASYRETLRRATSRDLYARNATNNLAHALVRTGSIDAAEALLVERVREFPDDPKMVGNLAKVRRLKARLDVAASSDAPPP